MELDYSRLPNKFDDKLYFNVLNNKVLTLNDVDEVLLYETDLIYDKFYKDEKVKALEKFENNIWRDIILDDVLKLKPIVDELFIYNNQRLALESLDKKWSSLPFKTLIPKEIIGELIKSFPKCFNEVYKSLCDTIELFDNVSLSDIEDKVFSDELLEHIQETLSKVKAEEVYKENFISRVIEVLYQIYSSSEEVNLVVSDKVKEQMKAFEVDLRKRYDKYRQATYDTNQEFIANSIINLVDYVFNYGDIFWIDDGKYVYMVTSLMSNGDKLVVESDRIKFDVVKEDIDYVVREGSAFKLILKKRVN